MNTGNNKLLNRVFTRNTFKNLIHYSVDDTYNNIIKRYIENIKNKSNRQLIEELYSILEKKYRNEYFYKNTLLNKLLLGVHSPKTTTVLTELPIDKSKADFILINGKAIVFEIKTELDNFERLSQQIESYYKAFNHVVVVTSESHYKEVDYRLNNTPVGIYVLTDKNRLSIRKKPIEDNTRLDIKTIFKILRKKEYESILIEFYKDLPEVSQFKYYSECERLFCNLEVSHIYPYFLKELKKRHWVELNLYKNVPYELKFLMYFLNLNSAEYQKLNDFLDTEYGG